MESSKRKERLTACALVALSIVYSLGCLGTRVGKIENPGAGLIPWLIAIGLVLFTTLNAFKTFKRNDPPKSAVETEDRSSGDRAVIGIAGIVLIYPFLLYTLKFILATSIAVFVMLRFLKYKTVLRSLVMSIVVSAFFFALFALLLGVTFPGGPMEEILQRLR